MDERMDSLWSIERFCRWKNDGAEPTKAQRNSISRMCRDGTLPAIKVCGQWRIDTMKLLEGARNGY